jgi:arylsulfatase A-like enzyme
MPTILDLLNIKIPYYARGISLVPLLEGNKQAFFDRHIYGQAQYGKVSCRFKNWKYITDIDLVNEDYVLNGKGEELYDLVSDPKEKLNLINVKPEVAKQLKVNIETDLYRHKSSGMKK